MEAVPRLPMLSFPGRTFTKPVEFGEHLKRYIRDHYHEDPESYNSEINELESLRQSAVKASTDFVGCATLKKYYCQLNFLTSRFRFDETAIKLSFTWSSAFDHNYSESGDIQYEMKSILYNIATLHSALGALDTRTTPEGMKISCTHFQCASWAFQVLSKDSNTQSEINSHLMTFMMYFSLGQAQECILEKSMTGNRKPNLIAKVAMQVVEYLRLTLKNLDSFKKSNSNAVELVGSKLLKIWQRHCDFKICYYTAVTLFHQGLQAEEQQKMGERIAFYQGAVEKLDEAAKLAKNLEKAKVIGETLTFANDVIRGKLTAAQKENEFVYHEKVPPLASLPEVKGASLIKGIPFSLTDTEVAGHDIFGRLVPLEAHEASSLYSEEKAKLLRKITSEIKEKDEELEMYLASMQLDSLAFEENFDALPQEVVDCCADLNSRDAVAFLTDTMVKINTVYLELQSKIKGTDDLIKDEEAKEKEFCLIIGTKRTPNHILTEQRREVAKYREAHQAALTSNQALESAIAQHKENIQILSKPLNSLVESLPSVAEVETEGDKATRMEVQRLLNKVREMQTQRRDFEGQLRANLQDDDVTKQLVTNQEDTDEFFKQQINKHKPLVDLLKQNMTAQSNILQALSEVNAAYGATRRMINQMKGQRAEIISSLLSSYNAFLNISQKADEAKEFYSKLETQVNKLHSRVKSFCKVQEEEREEKLAASVKKFGGNIHIPGRADSGSPYTDTSSIATGPKLKDFLQAGMGAKGMQVDMPSVDMSGPQLDYRYRGMPGAVTPAQMLPTYRNPPSRPAPVGSEKTDVRTSSSPSVAPSYHPSHFVPSAPSSAPSPHPSTSFYQPQGIGASVQPHQMPSQPSGSSLGTMATSAAVSQAYPSYGYPPSSSISISGTNLPAAPASYTTSVYSTTTQNYNTQNATMQQPSGSYPTSIPHHGGLGAQTSISSGSGSQQPLQGQPYAATNVATRPQAPFQNTPYTGSQTPYGGITYPSYPPGQQPGSHPFLSAPSGSSVSLPPSSSSAAGYISQAGVYNTTLSSSSLPQATSGSPHIDPTTTGKTAATSEVRNESPYYPPYPYGPSSNYVMNKHSTVPAISNQNAPHSDSYSYSTSSMTNSTSNQMNDKFKASSHDKMIPGGPILSYQQGQSQSSALASQSNNIHSHSHSGSVTYPINQGQSAGHSSMQGHIHSNVQGHNISYPVSAATADPYKQVHQQPSAATSFQQGYSYSQGNVALTSTSHYQHPVSTSSQTYPTLQATVSSTPYSYAQPSGGYCATATSNQPSASGHFQPAPQYPSHYAASPQVSQPTWPSGTTTTQPQPSVPSVASSATTTTKPSQGGISNLDLLSDIDMSASASSQWSVLAPQTAPTSADPSKPLNTSMAAPDVTATTSLATDEEKKPKENGTAHAHSSPEFIVTNSGSENLSLSSSPAPVIDLTKLAKPKRSVTTLDPLSKDETLSSLVAETERFSKFVQGLDKKSLNGPTNLELKWNELCDHLETKCSHLKVSVGRCYPLKNRFPDNLSFDTTRVPLPSARDDYINASYVQLKSVEDSMPLIITQAPMPNTFSDFWTMVWENQVELIVCLNTDAEVKGQVYLPKDGTDCLECGNFSLALKQARPSPNDAWIQRTLQLTHNTQKLTRVVLHIQFLTWPPSAMPESPILFLQLIAEVHGLQKQQRNKLNPVVVHCVSGTGRSGLFAVLSSYTKHLQNTGTLADVWNLVIELSQQRRAAMQDRTHLLFLYSAALYHAQEILMKRGILTDKATFEEGPREKTHVRHPSSDLLNSDLNRMKAKLGLADEPAVGDATNLSRSESQSSLLSGGSSTGRASQSTPPLTTTSISPSPTHSAKGTKLGATDLPPNLAASLDPSCLVLTTPNPAKAKKITKESFLNASGKGVLEPQATDPADPLSVLDPLWNMKKT